MLKIVGFIALCSLDRGLADQLVTTRSEDQILTLDWSEGADSINLADFSQEAWIVTVANWAAEALTAYGFTSTNVNLVGHSFGGMISGELAAALSNGVNTVLAIDPAEDPAFIVSGSLYSTDHVIFGGSNSNYSWAFYTPGIAGNEETPITADEAFVVENSEHSLLVDLVSSMIIAPVGSVTRFFSLDRLLALSDGPWLPDAFNENGQPGQAESGYEAVIRTPNAGPNEGITAVGIDYQNKNPFPVPEPGDYDNDLDVDGADFLQWQRTYAEAGSNLPADGNFTATIDRGDLRIWQHNFAASPPPVISGPIQATKLADSNPDTTPLAKRSLAFELFPISDNGVPETTIGDSALEEWFPSAVGQPFYAAEVATLKAERAVVALSSEGEARADESWLTDELLERVFG